MTVNPIKKEATYRYLSKRITDERLMNRRYPLIFFQDRNTQFTNATNCQYHLNIPLKTAAYLEIETHKCE